MSTIRLVVNKLMAAWLIVFGILAFLVPGAFTWLHPYVTYLLGAVILVMSLTLTTRSLSQVFKKPRALISGFVIKWVTVPLLAVIAARLVYSHQHLLAAGTILDGATPAGVSSNLFAYIGHGSVGLAVSLTFIHTILAPILTPAVTSTLASKYVPVSFMSLFIQMIELVLVPVILGLVIRYSVGEKRIVKAEPVLPVISAIFLYAIEVALISPNVVTITKNMHWIPIVTVVTTVLIIVNMAVAYWLAKGVKVTETQARTILFDTGVYNSGLGAVLAAHNFGGIAILPPLMNMIMNLIVGAIWAAYWQNKPAQVDAHRDYLEGVPPLTPIASGK